MPNSHYLTSLWKPQKCHNIKPHTKLTHTKKITSGQMKRNLSAAWIIQIDRYTCSNSIAASSSNNDDGVTMTTMKKVSPVPGQQLKIMQIEMEEEGGCNNEDRNFRVHI